MSGDPASAGQPYGGGPALRRCVSGDLAEFASEYWGRQAKLSKATGRFDDLLTLDGVDELLSRRGLRTPFIRIAKDGAVVGDKQFTGGGGAGADIGDQVRDDKVAALFSRGHTVILQGLHRTWPALIDFAMQLGVDTGQPVQVNAYITPPQSQGFAAHYDVHDVFVLQFAGEKLWTIHQPVFPDPLRTQPWTAHVPAVEAAARDTEPVIDEVLSPGDALYVPRGFLHSAKALGGVSGHLTVGLHTLTRYMLVRELLTLAADRTELRAALPLGVDPGDPDQLAPHLEEVAAILADHVRATPATAVARKARRNSWSSYRSGPLGPLAQAAAIRELQIGHVVRLRPGIRYRLVLGDRVLLQLADRTISLPSATGPAMERLCGGDDVKVGELPGLDDADQLVLVRRMLTEAVVVPA